MAIGIFYAAARDAVRWIVGFIRKTWKYLASGVVVLSAFFLYWLYSIFRKPAITPIPDPKVRDIERQAQADIDFIRRATEAREAEINTSAEAAKKTVIEEVKKETPKTDDVDDVNVYVRNIGKEVRENKP
jgi:hypothetical protein